ncbi:MAG: DNA polymerase III subunit delta [Cytophagaceae bacterium]|jgi:DNA polymerase-3 subunit delta|nr:DNA polymerase III subunit delta [Cytophagaceae bacterium]
MAKVQTSPDSVMKDLKSGKYAPIYFLHGEEPYYVDWIANYIEQHCLQETEKSFNQTIVYGKDTTVSAVIQAARKFPMFSDRQVVIVKEAQELSGLFKEENEKLVAAYMENPLPSTVLVFCHKYKKIDSRKKLSKSIQAHAVVVESSKLYDNQIEAWVSNLITEKGLKITPQATKLIAESIGNDLSRIANEIDKLKINIKQVDKPIDENLVEEYIGVSKEYNVFELQKAIGEKNTLKVFTIIRYFALNPKVAPPIMVIANLYTYFVKLLMLHSSADKSKEAVAKLLSVHPFFVSEYITASKLYSKDKCVACIHYLREADKMVKGYGYPTMEEDAILSELLYKILH